MEKETNWLDDVPEASRDLAEKYGQKIFMRVQYIISIKLGVNVLTHEDLPQELKILVRKDILRLLAELFIAGFSDKELELAADGLKEANALIDLYTKLAQPNQGGENGNASVH